MELIGSFLNCISIYQCNYTFQVQKGVEVWVSQDLWLGTSKNWDIEILHVKLNITHYSYLPLKMEVGSVINNDYNFLVDWAQIYISVLFR